MNPRKKVRILRQKLLTTPRERCQLHRAGDQKIDTYAVTFPNYITEITIPVGDKIIRLVPYGKSVGGNCPALRQVLGCQALLKPLFSPQPSAQRVC